MLMTRHNCRSVYFFFWGATRKPRFTQFCTVYGSRPVIPETWLRTMPPAKNIEENISKFGIVLPETSQERPQTGKVVAVGDGENFNNEKVEMKVKIGDKILFQKYAGVELKIDGKNYIVLQQIDVIGVFND